MEYFSLYEIIWMFFIYAFAGWCTEVAYAAVKHGKFVNRGFLNGTVCPVYGFGVVIIILLLTPLTDRWLLLFLGSILITSSLEFLTGWVLEKLFHAKWWDYSANKFNLKGYICLEFSLIWGLAATFVMCMVQPVILGFVCMVPHTLGVVCICLFLAGIAVDLTATVITIHNMQKHLKLLTAMAGEIHQFSDRLGDNISDAVLNAAEFAADRTEPYVDLVTMVKTHRAEEKAMSETHRAQEKALAEANRTEEQALFNQVREEEKEKAAAKWAQRLAEDKMQLEGLRNQFRLKLEVPPLGELRILKAFTSMKSSLYQEALDQIRELDQMKRVRRR